MRAHILTIAAAGLFAAPLAAEPAKAPESKASEIAGQPVVVLAAAAEVPQIQQPQQSPNAAPAAKPVRHARVTTCRCGNQDPGE